MSGRFTDKQGQYLAFIDSYMVIHGRAPAEADLQRFFGTTPPTIHQMILKLDEKGLISRIPWGGWTVFSFTVLFLEQVLKKPFVIRQVTCR